MLTIRQTKFGKSRQVPLHPSTVEALQRYRTRAWPLRSRHARRRRSSSARAGSGWGSRSGDTRCIASSTNCARNWAGSTAAPTTRRASTTCGTPSSCGACCCGTQQGVDVDQAMLSLSTYVGHAKVTNTYWYLTAVPELMAVAGAALRALRDRAEASAMREAA